MNSSSFHTVATERQHVKVSVPIIAATMLLFVLLYLVPLGYLPLTIPDEARYAEIPREMLANGDWIVPHLNGLRYFEKPPMGYWLDAISMGLLGQNNFAARLTSALAVGLTAYLVYLVGVFGGFYRRIALTASIIYMTFFEVYLAGTANVLDNLLALFLTAGIVSVFRAETELRRNWRRIYWILSGVAFGLAFLTKGFLAFAVPVIVLVPWLFWSGRGRALLTHGWLSVVVALLVSLPWALLVAVREPDFWHYFLWIEHFKRFFAENAQHKQPFYYFLLYTPVLAFPWISLVPAALSGLRGGERERERTTMRFLWLWLLLPFLFFSVSSGKLFTYILPCFAPFSLLMAAGLYRYLSGDASSKFDFGIIFTTLVLGTALVALLITQNFALGSSLYDDTEQWRAVLLAACLAMGVAIAPISILSNHVQTKLLSSLVMFAPLLMVIHFALPEVTWKRKMPGVLFEKYGSLIADDSVIVSDASMAHATAWYLKRDDIYLTDGGEMSYGLSYKDSSHRHLDEQGFAKLIASTGGGVALLCLHGCGPAFVSAFSPYHPQRYKWGEFVMFYSPGKGNSLLQH